ncbi:phage portal protein [Cytobacillus kochii]|uniref:phage portal protein n=1 Tax=Cytobacillus kochii TaxID=859143 RepID=UPI001CD34446|nr:phage portal protein [Cytobacillus kochii]MCA1027337.1 phage portal protein [Cytobacillus kochii]
MNIEQIKKYLKLLRQQQRDKQIYQDYYEGKFDILKNYAYNDSRSNMKVVINYFRKFVHDEVAYALGNRPSYISMDDDLKALSLVDNHFAKWIRVHNQRLVLEGLKFGESYEIKYTDNLSFKCGVLTPLNTLVVERGNVEKKVELALHTYSEGIFEQKSKLDVYYKNMVYTYRLESDENIIFESKRRINFKSPPITVYSPNLDRASMLDDIKSANDAFCNTLSDLVNEVSDFRQALIKVAGGTLEDEDIPNMKKKGVINVPTGVTVDYLIKELNDSFVQNLLNTLEDKIYKAASHMDTNERLQSNLSGSALRSRLISLENKCIILQSQLETIDKSRIKDFFDFIYKKTKEKYAHDKIKLRLSMNIPVDITSLADSFSKLGDIVPQETLLAQIPFVENPAIELEKWFKEQERKARIGSDLAKADN